jgi:ribonuclease J
VQPFALWRAREEDMSANLRIVPLGGLGEVGKNMISVEYGRNVLVIDVGMMFPEAATLGVDFMLPD